MIDSGAGIADEILLKIFDPFYSTKEVGKGSGMGLSIVHGIMHSWGGHILVTSSPESGTTVCLWFPLIEGDAITAIKEVDKQAVTSSQEFSIAMKDTAAGTDVLLRVVREGRAFFVILRTSEG